ncbi:MAG: hypothetical protein QOH45_778, partial [Pseudonocardiales bacterium]|nr:hypothetical protein [Pseudonocardiales bacterium]
MVQAGAGEIDADQGTVALLWGLREPPRRGPRPGLTVEQIALAAMRIADADGLDA